VKPGRRGQWRRSFSCHSAWFACQCLFAVDLAAAGEKYPSRPVHFVVGFTAGGPNDIVARILSEWLSDHLGQQFVVENRAVQAA
jgi:Uncharacterized protein conserved in bacteria